MAELRIYNQLLRAGVARAVVIHVTLTSQVILPGFESWTRCHTWIDLACVAFEGNDV